MIYLHIGNNDDIIVDWMIVCYSVFSECDNITFFNIMGIKINYL